MGPEQGTHVPERQRSKLKLAPGKSFPSPFEIVLGGIFLLGSLTRRSRNLAICGTDRRKMHLSRLTSLLECILEDLAHESFPPPLRQFRDGRCWVPDIQSTTNRSTEIASPAGYLRAVPRSASGSALFFN